MCCVCMCGVLSICICRVLRYICINVHVCVLCISECVYECCMYMCIHMFTCYVLYLHACLWICVHVCVVCVYVLLCTCVSVHVSVLCICVCVKTHTIQSTHVDRRIHSRVGELRKTFFLCFWLILNFCKPHSKRLDNLRIAKIVLPLSQSENSGRISSWFENYSSHRKWWTAEVICSENTTSSLPTPPGTPSPCNQHRFIRSELIQGKYQTPIQISYRNTRQS